MMKIVLILVLVCAAQAEDVRQEYLNALAKYGKGLQSLSPKSAKAHFQSFVKFNKGVKKNNADPESTYTAANNMFSIETPEERKQHLGRNASRLNLVEREEEQLSTEEMLQLIARADEQKDYSSFLPTPKDQGNCGSCWTYGSIAPLEYQVNSRSGKDVVSFSEQMLLDCVYERKNGKGPDGCEGGMQDQVYKWMASHGSHLALEKDHPYQGKDLKCAYKTLPNGFSGWKVASAVVKYPGDQKMLIAMSNSKIGVLTVAVHVNDAFSSYSSGVFSDKDCTRGQDNHAVSASGYGIRDGVPYFRIRNSWGPYWGEGGYINIKRSITQNLNMCRVSEFAEFPVVTKDGGDDEDGSDEETTDDSDLVAWQIVKKRKLWGWIGKVSQLRMALDDAKEACIGNDQCKGVVCSNKNGKCGLRSSVKGIRHAGFTSHIISRS